MDTRKYDRSGWMNVRATFSITSAKFLISDSVQSVRATFSEARILDLRAAGSSAPSCLRVVISILASTFVRSCLPSSSLTLGTTFWSTQPARLELRPGTDRSVFLGTGRLRSGGKVRPLCAQSQKRQTGTDTKGRTGTVELQVLVMSSGPVV